MSTFEDKAKVTETKVQELSLYLFKATDCNSKIQCSSDDTKAKERTTLDKSNLFACYNLNAGTEWLTSTWG